MSDLRKFRDCLTNNYIHDCNCDYSSQSGLLLSLAWVRLLRWWN